MKKAIFLCDGPCVPSVYPKHVIRKLKTMVDLAPEVIRGNELHRYAAALRETELIFSTWGMPNLSEDEIEEHFPVLKGVFYGAGSVQDFARPFLRRGVAVFSAWAANAVPVIEFTSSLIQLSLKGFLPVCRMTHRNWLDARELASRYPGAYTGVSVGLIGAGMIGRGVMERLRILDVEVLVYDPYCRVSEVESAGAKKTDDLKELFAKSQVVSNHTANLPSTKELLRYEHFAAMPPYGTFVNTGRNSQVHIPGLMKALGERPDLTVFLDVTDPDEPPSPDNPLLGCDSVYLTPHIAGSMALERGRPGAYMAEECERWLAGRPVYWQVTPQMLDTMA